MSREEVVIRMKKLDVLYNELDILDSKVKFKKIKKIDFLFKNKLLKNKLINYLKYENRKW